MFPLPGCEVAGGDCGGSGGGLWVLTLRVDRPTVRPCHAKIMSGGRAIFDSRVCAAACCAPGVRKAYVGGADGVRPPDSDATLELEVLDGGVQRSIRHEFTFLYEYHECGCGQGPCNGSYSYEVGVSGLLDPQTP